MDRIQRGLMYLEDLDFMRIVGVSAVDVLSRENERAILSFTSVGFDKCICGHRQVVRHQLPNRASKRTRTQPKQSIIK